jgi:2,5-diketo-D-gluconate reductase A
MTALAPTIPLLHGAQIPVIGLGTWPLRGAEAAAAVRTAIEAGYRLVDTAENYQNEDGVGQGIRDSGIDRSEIFVTTKFNKRWHSVEGARQAFEASCQRLGVDYIDLLLIHWPNPDQDRYVQAVEGLAALLEAGSVRAIGASNFKPAHLQRVIEETGIVVDVNQIQLSPYTTRESTRAFDAEHGIVTESWSPIGGSSDDLRSDPVITAIAERHGKTPTQVVLRWHVQLGLVTIPKSGHPGRIAENIDIFDFKLDVDEMASINALDQGEAAATDSDTTGH